MKQNSQTLNSLICVLTKQKCKLGSGCDSVGRAVTSINRGPWFKSTIEHLFTVNCIE